MFWRCLSLSILAGWFFSIAGVVMTLVVSGSSLAGAPEGMSADVSRTMELGRHSLVTAGGAALLAMVIAVPAAFGVMVGWDGWRRLLLLGFAAAPVFIPSSVVAVASVWALGARGVVPELYYFVAGEADDGLRWAPIFSLYGVTLCFLWAYGAFAFLGAAASLSGIDRGVLEAGLLEGSLYRVAVRLLFPMMVSGLLPGVLLVFLLSLTDFSVPESLRTQPLLVVDVYMQFGVFYDQQAALGSALIVGCLAIVAVLFLVWSLPMLAGGDEAGEVSVGGASYRGMGFFRWFGAVVAVVPTLLLGILLVYTMGKGGSLGETAAVVADTTGKELVLSALLATGAAFGALLVGVFVSLGLKRYRWLMLPFLVVGILAITFPGPIYGIALKRLTNLPPDSLPFSLDNFLAGLDQTYWPLLISYWLRFSPLVALLMYSSLKRLPTNYFDMYYIESSSIPKALVVWILPIIWPVCAVAFLMVWVLSFGEAGAAMILIPPGTSTLSVRLLTLMHNAPTNQVSAMCLVLMIPAILLVPLVVIATRSLQRFREVLN